MARKPARKARRTSRNEDAEEDSGSEYVPGASEEEDEDDEELEEDADEDSGAESEPSEEVIKPTKRKSSLSGGKRKSDAEDTPQKSDSESLAFEYEVFVRKVRKGNPQKKSKGEWVPLKELKWLLESDIKEEGKTVRQGRVSSELAGGKRRCLQAGRGTVEEPGFTKSPGKDRTKRKAIVDLSEDEDGEPVGQQLRSGKWKAAKKAEVSHKKRALEQSNDEDESEEKSSKRKQKKVSGTSRTKASRLVVGGEPRSEDEETDADNSDDFINDEEEDDGEENADVSNEKDDVSKRKDDVSGTDVDEEVSEGEKGSHKQKRLQKLQEARGASVPVVEFEDEVNEIKRRGSLRKNVIESDTEEEDEIVPTIARPKSPDIPLKEGLTQPVHLEIPEPGAENESAGEESQRKRRKVELLEDEENEGEEQDEQKQTDESKKPEVQCDQTEAQSMLDENVKEQGIEKELDQPHLEENGTEESYHTTNMQAGSDEEENEEEGTEEFSGRHARRRKTAEGSGASILERMIDNRNATLGLIEKEEESEGEESGQQEEDNMDGFIVPDENGDDRGYNGGPEQEGSEGGVEDEGQPTGDDEFALSEGVFWTYLEYLLRTMQDPGYRDAARSDGELMRLVRRCEEALISKRTLLVESSAWKPAFKAAMDSRPILSANDTEKHTDCQACGRSNHAASHVMTFSGPRYSPREVWEFDFAATPSSQLHRASGENEQVELESFFVGKYCYARASVYHALHHYKWHLQKRLQRARDELPNAMKEAAEVLLSNKSFVATLHRNFNGFVTAAEQYLEQKEKRGGGLVTMEEVESATRFFELVEELQEGGIDV